MTVFFFFCSNSFCSIRLSIHPSMSAIPSHSLSVFHHSISKPDPHVNSVPPPHPRLNQSQLVPMAFQICNFLTHRLQSRAQCIVGRLALSQKQTWSNSFDHPPPLFLNIIFQPSVLTPCDFFSSISISFLLSVIQLLSVWIIGHSAGVVG